MARHGSAVLPGLQQNPCSPKLARMMHLQTILAEVIDQCETHQAQHALSSEAGSNKALIRQGFA